MNVYNYCKAEKLLKGVDHKTCSYCLTICINKFERVKHEATVHENNGKYICDICGKTYSNKNALGYHLSNKHNDGHGEKKPSCELCCKTFTTDASLNRHIEIAHKGPDNQSNYECDECGEKFSRKDNLRNHVKEQHKMNDKKMQI